MPINLQGSSSYLQDNSPTLQGGSLSLQGSAMPTPTVPKKITYGNTSATSPAKQQYINSLQDNPQDSNAGQAQVDSSGQSFGFGTPSINQSNSPSTVNNPPATPLDTAKSDYLTSLKSAISGLQTAQQNQGTLTPEALKAQQDLNTFRGQEQQGLIGLTGQGRGIPLGLVRGQQGKLLAQGQAQEQTLQNEFANQQTQSIAKRAGDVAAAQTALGFYNPKPESVSIGSNLVRLNPTTGQYETVAQGQSYADKQSSQAVLALGKVAPDVGILPTDSFEIASAKASNSPFYQASHSGQSATMDANGNLVFYQNRGPNVAANAGFQTVSTPTQTSGRNMTFTLASDGKTVLANGTPVDLNTFRQMTGQTGSTTDFSAVQGNNKYSVNNKSTSTVNKSTNQARIDGEALLSGTDPKNIPTNRLSQAQAYALSKNPNYDINAASGGADFQKSVDTQKFLANSNTVINTIDQFVNIASQLKNGNYPILNRADLQLRANTGDPLAAQAIQLSDILGEEFGKIVGSGAGSDFGIKLGQSLFSPGMSPSQIQSLGKQAKDRVQNKVQEYNNQFKQNTPSFNNNVQSIPANLFNGLF